MTQWSREYLYTGKEEEKYPSCKYCKNSFKYNTDVIDQYFCIKREDDCSPDEFCQAFRWKL